MRSIISPFVSPSNHRAHHGVNDIYLDKNYGGILILWDRLFGTFVEEDDAEPVVYGTRSPLRSWSPLRANLEVYQALWADCRRTRKFADKLRIWFARPGWRPADVAAAYPAKPFDIGRARFDPPVNIAITLYCVLQFVLVLLVTTHFLAVGVALPVPLGCLYGLWVFTTLWTTGGLMENGKIHRTAESLRLLATGAAVFATGMWFGTPLTIPAQVAIAAACLLSLAGLWFAHRASALKAA